MHILVGIRQRLDYLSYLGIDAVLLSAFYDSPFEHLGRDIRDFMAVGTKYGSIEDFELLVTELHRRGKTAQSQRVCCMCGTAEVRLPSHSVCAVCVVAYEL